ncbi:MAG: lytic transglycosylase domain-containing protein [Gammaproteobacteria bacterium]|nr:lytic transglycosylase domain-containing protein [Gammaproteobacteria bacterium]
MKTLLKTVTITIALLSFGSQAEQIYIYKERDGTQWITNHRLKSQAGRYKFVKYHGRPTATRSCHKVTRSILNQRAKKYQQIIEHAAKKHSVSKHLIRAIIEVESCFDEKAHSRVGAQGLMQLMPKTAKYLGVTNSLNGKQNIEAGVRYYAELQRRFNYNYKMAIAAYNAGPTAVEKYQGIPPYKETQGYVKKVLKKYRAFLTAKK